MFGRGRGSGRRNDRFRNVGGRDIFLLTNLARAEQGLGPLIVPPRNLTPEPERASGVGPPRAFMAGPVVPRDPRVNPPARPRHASSFGYYKYGQLMIRDEQHPGEYGHRRPRSRHVEYEEEQKLQRQMIGTNSPAHDALVPIETFDPERTVGRERIGYHSGNAPPTSAV